MTDVKDEKRKRVEKVSADLTKFVCNLQDEIYDIIKKRCDKFKTEKDCKDISRSVDITCLLNIGEILLENALEKIASLPNSFIIEVMEEGKPTDFIKQRIKDMWKKTIGEEF